MMKFFKIKPTNNQHGSDGHTSQDNLVPIALTVPRKVPYPRREDEVKKPRKLEENGVIEEVVDRSPEFCSVAMCL